MPIRPMTLEMLLWKNYKSVQISQVENTKQGDWLNRKSNQKSKGKVICYCCDKTGHALKDSWKKQWDEKKGRRTL